MTEFVDLDDVDNREPGEAVQAANTSVVRWPPAYQLEHDGLWFERGDDRPRLQLTGPFQVLGLARDPHGQGWALALTWADRDGRQHRGFVPHADLLGTGADVLRSLASAGLLVSPVPSRIKLLKEGLAQLECEARVRLVKRAGWYEHQFVLPTQTIGCAGSETVIYDGHPGAARYETRGSLREWTDQVAALCAGNSRLILALSAAFAGPINDLLQGEGGGIHLVGGSSLGKSTALTAAGSVWGGGGRAGFTQTWRATGNGLESVARSHSGTLLVLDELGELDAREAGSTAYLLTNGVSKIRATRDADTRPRAEWRVMLLSAGEVGLADKIAEGGRKAKAGQLVRLVDVPADAQAGLGLFEDTKGQEPAQFARLIKDAALRTYGTAGPAFVDVLTRDIEAAEHNARAQISAKTKRLLSGCPAPDGQMIRVADRFALISAAGEMARAALGLPWREGEAEAAAATCFAAWRSLRSDDGPGELVAALQAIRSTIERHGESRFRNQEHPDLIQPPVRDLLGYRILRDGELCYAFTATGWAETLAGTGDPRGIVDALHERGVLISGKDRTHRLFLKVDGRSVPTYAVSFSSLFGAENAG